MEFTSALVSSDHTDGRLLLTLSDSREQMSLLCGSQFALIRSNQGNGAAAGLCREITLPLAFALPELRSGCNPEGGRHPSWPRCSFLRQAIKADTAGQFTSKFVCFWKHGEKNKKKTEHIYMRNYLFLYYLSQVLILKWWGMQGEELEGNEWEVGLLETLNVCIYV